LRIPSLEVVVAFNYTIREADEWFDEPDELDRVKRILDRLTDETDPVVAAALSVGHLAQSQAVTEGNKRTAVLVGRWILDDNGLDGAKFIRENDAELAQLLLQAARGADVSGEIVELFNSRR
jgi:prophage maintenance system killer protein